MIRALLWVWLLVGLHSQAAPLPSMPIKACVEHTPYGLPAPAVADSKQVCRFGYALQHDNRKKVPLWVAYTITPERALGCFPRTSGFSAEPSVPAGKRAEDTDYANSGYDRGHLAPNNDMRWHMQVEDDANVLSNAAPQNANLNRGAWKMLEDRVRVLTVERKSPILVYAGPILSLDDKVIGLNKVTVPTAFYKVLVDRRTKEVVAFIYPNREVSGDPGAFMVPYETVIAQIGFVLPLPTNPIFSTAPWNTTEKTVTDIKDCLI